MISIVTCTLIDYFMGLHTPKLEVPDTFEPTLGYGVRYLFLTPFANMTPLLEPI